MAGSIALSRSYLVYAVCLPLAVLVGYVLAEPMDRGSIAVIVLLIGLLSVPVFLRWHHPLLIFSWNSMCGLVVLPVTLCMALTCISFFFSALNRAIGRPVPFFEAPGVAKSLIALGAVVFLTAMVNGGAGFGALGSNVMGGKRYISLYVAILCYFAMACHRIHFAKAPLYLGLFWLSSLTLLLGYFAAIAGPSFDFLGRLFPVESSLMGDRAYGNSVLAPQENLFRLGSAGLIGSALYCFVLARYGIRGVLDFNRPWRFGLFMLGLAGSIVCSFRTALVTFALTFLILFYLEGLFRAKYVLILGSVMLALATAIFPFTRKLPLSVQRTISFLPVEIDPMVRNSADGSTEWRLQMWQELLPQVPKYLFKGKGYALDPRELYEAALANWKGAGETGEGQMIVGDYHSGPLSVIIPLGIYGVIAFVWFLCASLRVLYRNYRYGDPALKTINTFFMAYFMVRIFIFTFVFGSLYSELVNFCGLIGFSVCLNGVASPPSADALKALEESEEAV